MHGGVAHGWPWESGVKNRKQFHGNGHQSSALTVLPGVACYKVSKVFPQGICDCWCLGCACHFCKLALSVCVAGIAFVAITTHLNSECACNIGVNSHDHARHSEPSACLSED